ncbi:hypothetical protein D3C71_1681750 [compost metagenome]
MPPQALFELLVDRVDLRQPQGSDKRANQPRAGQIHPFAESAAQYGKAHTSAIGDKAIEKCLAGCLVHARLL